ncbi:MAG: hypothetical protein US60_C0028G0023 [Microgenomates group bacterium GW2011_GWC1_37_8]|uniref:Uncharacterized protein n=2 Tax=Candidatus Woeseibacteriota TaxID=1752722 RepID=A0A0G0NFR0_9BACT|nr:MAG: hypothetical protein US60_C0028G0023 [Microgenomates group bacterium GW2011_GWC1_37_8]KKQ84714.1 MAG: hypothetical protein UT08_C0014G0006 [Candidatus Woesebacteria bacterium GW2011_GWB1_38_8]OGM22196.1 MAG: hypothetical protein A2863_02230 [Candidatus Woesebacteria bacterium RIFCSPHIGHO2_01_FULL_38_9b]
MHNPVISRKLTIFPIPTYRRKINRIIPNEIISPRLVFAKIVEALNRINKNKIRKNKKTTPELSGLVK